MLDPKWVFFCDFKNENTHKPWTIGVVSPTLRYGKPSHPSLSEMIRNKPPLPLVAAQVSNLARRSLSPDDQEEYLDPT
jgi:hypothetical protein